MSILTQNYCQQSTRSKERFALLFIAFFILQFLSIFNANAYESPKFGFFIKNEVNDGNNISGIVGIGAGVKFDHLQIEAFTRLRQIDGEYWKAENQAFTGAKLSVVF